jgi:D-alanyl-D-alanine endopeptidase (penicillin-binding protein 7)
MKKPIVVVGILTILSAGTLLYAVHSRAGDPDTVAAPAAESAAPFIHAAEIASLAQSRTPALRSSVALVMDAREGVTLYARDIDARRPIASLTKLMTAMVVLDAKLPLDEMIAAMTAKAAELGMTQTYYRDSSGLDSHNVSTARDLARLALAAERYPLITEFTTTEDFEIADLRTGKPLEFVNTNRLVRNGSWEIGLSKTGYTRDAGNCLVMEARIADRPVIVVLLNSWGKLSKYGDSTRIRDWLLALERRLRAQDSAVATTRS